MDLVQLLDIADKITTIGLLLGLGWGIKEKWIVPGWVYTQLAERNAELEKINSARASRLEEKLDSYEQEWRAVQSAGRSHERP